MSRNPWESKPHRFVVEELLDHYPVVSSPNSHAPAEADRSVPKLNKKKTPATKPRKRSMAAGAQKGR